MGYSYERLANPNAEIRVIILQPGRFEDKIRIRFQSRKLEHSTPEYEALSYVWGSQGDPSYALVYSHDLKPKSNVLSRLTKSLSRASSARAVPITRNLDIALRHLRHDKYPRSLWVDALSIDQSNGNERNAQVALMGQVYKNASHVVVWIGPSSSDSGIAMKWFSRIGSEFAWDSERGGVQPIRDSHDNQTGEHDESDHPCISTAEAQAIVALYERQYWERLWIRQECGLASSATVQCGTDAVPWTPFRNAVMFLESDYDRCRTENLLTLQFDMRSRLLWNVMVTHPQVERFRDLPFSFRDTKCLDPRDRIYAVRSLLSKDDAALNIRADYSRNVEKVYIDVAKRIMTSHATLNLLESCELSSRILKLPSWVPDWSSGQYDARTRTNSDWSACGWISSHALFLDDQSVSVAGIRVGAITQVQYVFEKEVEYDPEKIRSIIRALYKPPQEAMSMEQGPESSIILSNRMSFPETFGRTIMTSFFLKYFDPTSNLDHFQIDLNNVVGIVRDILGQENNTNFSDIPDTISTDTFLRQSHKLFVGRSFIRTSNGYMGLAPAETKAGDIICVLLGSCLPVVLRPIAPTKGEEGTVVTYRVVGPSGHIEGLMKGELIYRDTKPSRYRPINLRDECVPGVKYPEGNDCAMVDPEDGTLKGNPAEILEEAGISVERYQERPHILEVKPETLKGVGLALEQFILV